MIIDDQRFVILRLLKDLWVFKHSITSTIE